MAATAAQILIAYPQAGYALAAKIVEVSQRLGIPDPAMLANAINFESGRTFSPATRNPNGGATGLIQFYPRGSDRHVNDAAGRSLGTTTDALARMSAVDQMEFVYRYFAPYAGRLKTPEDVYMAIYYPAALGKGPDYMFPQSTWAQNTYNGQPIKTVRDYVAMANARARLTPVTEGILSTVTTAATVGAVSVGGTIVLSGLAVAALLIALAVGAASARRKRGATSAPL